MCCPHGNVNIRNVESGWESDHHKGLALQQLIVMFPREWEPETEATLSVCVCFSAAEQTESTLTESWKICGGVSVMGERASSPVRCTHIFSNDTFLSFFNGKQNFGFLRQERK